MVISSSASVAVTVWLVNPVDEQVIMAEPFVTSASSAAVSVTVWYVSQLVVVKLREDPEDTEMSESPELLEAATVLPAVGCALSFTWNVAVEPSGTERLSVFVAMLTTLITNTPLIVALADALTVVDAEFASPKVGVPARISQFVKCHPVLGVAEIDKGVSFSTIVAPFGLVFPWPLWTVIVISSSTSLAVTVWLVNPVDEQVIVAVPFAVSALSSAAASVTV